MAVSDLVSLMRTDLADPDAERFTDDVLTRCVHKAAFPVGRDLGVQLSVVGGAIMEYGATINHPSGAVVVIPPRPFLHPTMEKYRDEVLANYREALASILR